MNIAKNKLLPIIAALLLIYPSQLALNRPWVTIGHTGLATFAFILFLFITPTALRVSHDLLAYLICLLLMLSVSIFSSIVNFFWIHPLFVYGGYSVITGIMLLTFGTIKDVHGALRIFTITVACCTVSIMIMSVFSAGFQLYRYQGIFNNPNSMGWFTASMFSFFWGVLICDIKLNRSVKYFLFILSSFLLIFLLASNSRSAVAAVMISICVVFLPYFSTLRLQPATITLNIKKFRSLVAIILFLLVGVLALVSIGIADNVILKFAVKTSQGDFSAGRIASSLTIFSHWTWFGLGDEYKVLLGSDAIGHSTYMSQIAQYGLLPALIFFLFLFYIWASALCASYRGYSKIATIVLSVMSAFLVQALFETGSATPGVLIAVVMFVLMIAEKRNTRARRGLAHQ
jgi:hypothetical protein